MSSPTTFTRYSLATEDGDGYHVIMDEEGEPLEDTDVKRLMENLELAEELADGPVFLVTETATVVPATGCGLKF